MAVLWREDREVKVVFWVWFCRDLLLATPAQDDCEILVVVAQVGFPLVLFVTLLRRDAGGTRVPRSGKGCETQVYTKQAWLSRTSGA